MAIDNVLSRDHKLDISIQRQTTQNYSIRTDRDHEVSANVEDEGIHRFSEEDIPTESPSNSASSGKYFDKIPILEQAFENAHHASPNPIRATSHGSEAASTTIELQSTDMAMEDDYFGLNSKAIGGISNRNLIIPKSCYIGHDPPHTPCEEKEAVNALLEVVDDQKSEEQNASVASEFHEIGLSDFSMYLPPTMLMHPFEFRGLQHLTLSRHPYFLFDGILQVGSARKYVHGIPFRICSIGNYGEDHDEVSSSIWIQSDFNRGSDVYYKLLKPSPEYSRFHEGFIWIANFAKHFVDYCQASETSVMINNFRSDFSTWVQSIHNTSPTFRAWFSAHHNEDFRAAVCRNAHFLFKESIGVDESLSAHTIWSQILDMNYVNEIPQLETQTIVTPYIYDCFSHMRFGHVLKAVQPASTVKHQQKRVGNALHLTADDPISYSGSDLSNVQLDTIFSPQHERNIRSIKTGDVLAVTKDIDGIWKDERNRWTTVEDCWYILVQEIVKDSKGRAYYHGIWLYKPSDTACAKMKYPWKNELFLSDNCTCGQDGIRPEEILDIVRVKWYGDPSTEAHEPCIRQTYLENERFVTLTEQHKFCQHIRVEEAKHQTSIHDFPIGQTVLAPPSKGLSSKHDLEVYEVLNYHFGQNGSPIHVVLRQLQRMTDFEKNAEVNELVYTDVQEILAAHSIHSKCIVRYFSDGETIQPPYNRAGAGNVFFLRKKQIKQITGEVRLEPLPVAPATMIQGFDPSITISCGKLRGMDLYCGGGNFGRGLEEGGAVENYYAVDLDKAAIHTYSANLREDSKTELLFGSVDDLLQAAMHGNPKELKAVPFPGDVDFISAGSPCQGFSLLNMHKDNHKSMKNQSLVASVAAYVDFYRPKYGVLENVISMAQTGHGREEDVLSQLICALVGMGYQTHLILLDAWSSGSPQSRSRLFVSFAAPGMKPLEHPALSHSHPPKVSERGLGRLANGQAFGSRLRTLTPFKYMTAAESFHDLPVIGDGFTNHCTRYPDHVLEFLPTEPLRQQIQAIPLYPRGSNFASAWRQGHGTMPAQDRLLFPSELKENGKPRLNVQPISHAWERAHPDKLLVTITVTMQVASARGGATLHWNEHRGLTLMEYRRAQTFPDEEVLVGSRAQCLKLIGNSVARSVAVSLGLKLREAWAATKLGCDASPTTEAATAKANLSTGMTSIRQSTLSRQEGYSKFNEKLHARLVEVQDSEETSRTEAASLLHDYCSVALDAEFLRQDTISLTGTKRPQDVLSHDQDVSTGFYKHRKLHTAEITPPTALKQASRISSLGTDLSAVHFESTKQTEVSLFVQDSDDANGIKTS